MFKNRKLIGIIAGLFLLAITGYRFQREMVLRELTRGGDQHRGLGSWNDEAGRTAFYTRKRRFANLWLARDARDIVPEVEGYLKDPSLSLRVSAIRALGKLENPAALEALEKVRLQIERQPQSGVRLQTVQMAIARIEGRQLQGKKKLNAFCRSLNLSWGEVCSLSVKVNAPKNVTERWNVPGSPAVEIVHETVALLYAMGDKGENTQSYMDQLTLSPAEVMYLKCAGLPANEEAAKLVSYCVFSKDADIWEVREEILKNHVVSLGKTGSDQILELLKKVQADPNRYFPHPDQTRGYTYLFRAAAYTGRREAIPLLRRLQNHSFKWVAYYAEQAADRLEDRTAVPTFPASP